MRKIYSLLLLGVFMLLGTECVTANTYLKGSWNSWGEDDPFVYTDNVGTCSVFLPYNSVFDFKVYDTNGKWYSNSTEFTTTSSTSKSDVQFYDNDGNDSHFKTTAAGFYTFTWNSSTCKFSIAYPTGYIAHFDNNENWSRVLAYVWTGESKPLGDWNSLPIVASSGACDLILESAPENIIWRGVINDGGTDYEKKTITLPFGNYDYHIGEWNRDDGGAAEYKASVSKTISPTANGYATLCVSHHAELPETVIAYNGVYNEGSGTLTLSALSNSGIVYASRPVVLKSSNGSTPFTITINVNATPATESGTNNLHGTATQISTPANSYVLGYQESTTAFYHFTGANIPANKAYLVIDGGVAQAAGIRIIEGENSATNINSTEASEKAVKFFENGKFFIKKNGIIYDMMGAIVK